MWKIFLRRARSHLNAFGTYTCIYGLVIAKVLRKEFLIKSAPKCPIFRNLGIERFPLISNLSRQVIIDHDCYGHSQKIHSSGVYGSRIFLLDFEHLLDSFQIFCQRHSRSHKPTVADLALDCILGLYSLVTPHGVLILRIDISDAQPIYKLLILTQSIFLCRQIFPVKRLWPLKRPISPEQIIATITCIFLQNLVYIWLGSFKTVNCALAKVSFGVCIHLLFVVTSSLQEPILAVFFEHGLIVRAHRFLLDLARTELSLCLMIAHLRVLVSFLEHLLGLGDLNRSQ